MLTFILLWITKEQNFELPLLKIKVDISTAILLIPALLLILTIRYLYLCAHYLDTITRYLKLFNDCYSGDIKDMGLSFRIFYSTFKQRDLSENLNFYLFPIKRAPEWDDSINKFYGSIVIFLTNISILFTIIIPISSYFLLVFWLLDNLKTYIPSISLGFFVIISYLFLGVLFILAPIYWYYRVKPAREYFRKLILEI